MKEKCTENGKRILLLGVYGMEMVECGGTLLKNVQAGGASHAVFLFTGEQMQKDLVKAAEILRVSVEHMNLDSALITGNVEEKKKLIRAIRSFRPDIIITQDTEHCISDLDPGRRIAMTLILESIALAGRNFAIEEMEPLKPHGNAALYYMSPSRPNCLVDILPVWEEKVAAMDTLESQLAFSGTYFEKKFSDKALHYLVPEWDELETPLEKGRAVTRRLDMSTYMYHGASGHNHFLFSEAFRKQEMFEFDYLIC